MLPLINQPCLRHPSIIQLFKQLCHFFKLFPLIPALGGNIFSDRYLTVGGEVSKMQSSDKFQYIMCLLLGDFCAPGYFIDDAKLWWPDSLTFADINIHSLTAGVLINLRFIFTNVVLWQFSLWIFSCPANSRWPCHSPADCPAMSIVFVCWQLNKLKSKCKYYLSWVGWSTSHSPDWLAHSCTETVLIFDIYEWS